MQIGNNSAVNFKLKVGAETTTVSVEATGPASTPSKHRCKACSPPARSRTCRSMAATSSISAQLEPGVQIQDGTNFDPTKIGYQSISYWRPLRPHGSHSGGWHRHLRRNRRHDHRQHLRQRHPGISDLAIDHGSFQRSEFVGRGQRFHQVGNQHHSRQRLRVLSQQQRRRLAAQAGGLSPIPTIIATNTAHAGRRVHQRSSCSTSPKAMPPTRTCLRRSSMLRRFRISEALAVASTRPTRIRTCSDAWTTRRRTM